MGAFHVLLLLLLPCRIATQWAKCEGHGLEPAKGSELRVEGWGLTKASKAGQNNRENNRENNRAMRHICHSNAIARNNRFGQRASTRNIKKKNKAEKKQANFMPAYREGGAHAHWSASRFILLLQLRLIKKNKSASQLFNTVAVKTNNPKADTTNWAQFNWTKLNRSHVRIGIRALGLINCQS